MTNRAHENVEAAHEEMDSLELDKETLKDLEPDDKNADAKGGAIYTSITSGDTYFGCYPRSLSICITIRG